MMMNVLAGLLAFVLASSINMMIGGQIEKWRQWMPAWLPVSMLCGAIVFACMCATQPERERTARVIADFEGICPFVKLPEGARLEFAEGFAPWLEKRGMSLSRENAGSVCGAYAADWGWDRNAEALERLAERRKDRGKR